MPTILLTDRRVAALKPGRVRVEYFDRALPGFGLRVGLRGAKSWIVLYRLTPGGPIQRRTHDTPYPDLSLVQAREWAQGEVRKAQSGRDPAAEHLAAKAHTFGAAAEAYLEQHAKLSKRSWQQDASRLRRVLLPAWGPRPLTTIRRADVRALLADIVTRGAKVEANRTLALVRGILNYAVTELEWLDSNPAGKMKRPGGKERPRERVLSDDELRRLWLHLHTAPDDALPADARRLWTLSRAVLLLRLTTAQRGREVLSLRWRDLDGALWTIPGAIAKNGKLHTVPLNRHALAVLATVTPDVTTPTPDAYVFAGVRGTRQRRGVLDDLGIADVRPHDFRRTAATSMAKGGIPRFVVSKVLNHVDASITGVYDQHDYATEKRHALDTWADVLGAIVTPKPQTAAKVIRMRGPR